jgi:hypothetical protein
MSDHKFNKGQEVMIPNFLINGNRMDIQGVVTRPLYNRQSQTWRFEVCINEAYVILDENKIVDSNEYWSNKNGSIHSSQG